MKITPYTCFRCNYITKDKRHMRMHLYNRKKECPAISLENDIDLTDEIKEKILKNRVYYLPKIVKEPTFVQNIQYNNTMNNYIKNMDSIDKISKYLEYNDKETNCLEDHLEELFKNLINNLKENNFKRGTYDIDEDRQLELISDISKIKTGDVENMNIFYDEKTKELNIHNGCWDSYLVDRGLKELIYMLQNNLLNHYEQYLMKQYYVFEKNERTKQKIREDIERHYKFIGCFELEPFVKGKDDCDILGDEHGDFGVYKLEEKYTALYTSIVDDMKRYEINKMKKNILDILKSNTKKNIKDLNKKIVELMNIDEEFKKTIEL